MKSALQIDAVPLLSDNYAFVLSHAGSSGCAVIDPGEASGVQAWLRERALTAEAFLLTHHHPDHTGGLAALLDAHPGAEVFASGHDAQAARIEGVTHPLEDNASFALVGHCAVALLVPGHTLGAVAFFLPDNGALFTGDTLFAAGCGRLFEGDAPMMWASLDRLAALPPKTRVYFGHEYTVSNLRFAAHVEPHAKGIAERLRRCEAARAQGLLTVPSTVGEELQTNPFLRCREASLQAHTGFGDPAEVFASLRAEKDSF